VRWFRVGLCVALLLISSGGCGNAERDAAPASREARSARPPAAAPSKSQPRLVVEVAGDRVRLIAREIARRELLEELAFEAHFVLELGDFEPQRVTLRLEDASLDEVLGAVLVGTPYGIDYDFDRRVQTLRVGSFEEPPVALVPVARDESAIGVRGGESILNAPSPDRPASLRERQILEEAELQRLLDDPRPDVRAAAAELERVLDDSPSDARAAAAEREPLLDDPPSDLFGAAAELKPLLDDPSPEVRAEAVYDYDHEGPLGLDPLIDLALSDPDPGVRAAAAETLGHEGSPSALSTLVETLKDPSPEVLRISIETLALVGDKHHAASIRPLLGHPDAEVREAAEIAMELLE
jgi:hypothetical protein